MKLEDMKPGWLYAFDDPSKKSNLRICVCTKEGKKALVRPYPTADGRPGWYMFEPTNPDNFNWTELFELTLP